MTDFVLIGTLHPVLGSFLRLHPRSDNNLNTGIILSQEVLLHLRSLFPVEGTSNSKRRINWKSCFLSIETCKTQPSCSPWIPSAFRHRGPRPWTLVRELGPQLACRHRPSSTKVNNMTPKSTDHLIADTLAIGMEIRQHLEDRRRRLTPLQMDALTNAVTAIHNYFMSWKAHELACRDTMLLPTSATSRSAHRENLRGSATSPRKRRLKAL